MSFRRGEAGGWRRASFLSVLAAGLIGLPYERVSAQRAVAATASSNCPATILFSGELWDVHAGAGPLDAVFDACNVQVDATRARLTLRIVCRAGVCTSAEVATRRKFLYGTFDVQTFGSMDRLHPSVIVGIFTYPGDAEDGTREIDIEYARYGHAGAPLANYVVYPEVRLKSYRNAAHSIDAQLTSQFATHRFTWSAGRVVFESMNGTEDAGAREAACWTYEPRANARQRIPQVAAPLYLNIYPHDPARLPDGEYRIAITRFAHHKAGSAPALPSACR